MSDRTPAGQFLDAAIGLLRRLRDEEAGPIAAAGTMIADTVADGGRLFAFGAGHSSLAAQDLVYRAGGLALMNLLTVPGVVGVDVRPATLGSALERVEGLAGTVLDSSPLREGDLLVIISLSGRNVMPVEMATRARAKGVKVIGVTSVAYAAETSPRNPSGTFLKDHCDVVLDSGIAVGDAELTWEGVGAVRARVHGRHLGAAPGGHGHRGGHPRRPGRRAALLRSGNVDGGRAWNTQVMTEYGDRIFYQH